MITTELRNAKTGKQIAWTHGLDMDCRWEWISCTIAREFECDVDEVGCCDTDERFDNLTVRGEIVAYEITEHVTSE